jgi:hypothetical protein
MVQRLSEKVFNTVGYEVRPRGITACESQGPWYLNILPKPSMTSGSSFATSEVVITPSAPVGNTLDSPATSSFCFNAPPDIRQDDVQFGRNFTTIRKSYTDNDRCPLNLRPIM